MSIQNISPKKLTPAFYLQGSAFYPNRIEEKFLLFASAVCKRSTRATDLYTAKVMILLAKALIKLKGIMVGINMATTTSRGAPKSVL